MIQINNYDTIVAYATPTTTDYRITDKLVTGNYLILDPQASDYTYTITKNGSEIPVTSISANDVILYTKSLDVRTTHFLLQTILLKVQSLQSVQTAIK